MMALRVECKDAKGAAVVSEPSVDVFEGYWSPIDKEQTNPLRVLSWLLASTFVPLSNVKIPASVFKLAWDLSYTSLALFLGVVAPIIIISSAVRAYHAYVTMIPNDFKGLFIAAVGAYLVAQAVARLWPVVTRRAALSLWSSIILGLLMLVGLGLLAWPTREAESLPFFVSLTGPRVWLLGSAIALRFMLSFAKDFLVDAVGDIEIYTTHDENARFYQFREQIIQTVGGVVFHVLQSNDASGKPLYDKVFLVGHSLGGTVLMDVIIALHELVEEERISIESWRRIQGFVTFGTALEKTRFFFDARNENLSETLIRWRKDVYGHLFTADPSVLGTPPDPSLRPNGIYWSNFWYFTDVVANEIVSYTSRRQPGEDLTGLATRADHPICVNVRLRMPRTLWPHSYYLSDESFWHTGAYLGATAIVAHG